MQVLSLSKTWTPYFYEAERDYSKLQDRFLKNTFIALDFLHKTNALTITFEDEGVIETVDVIDVLSADTKHTITIIPGTKNAYNPKLNSIMFYDTHGVYFRKNYKKQWFRRNKGYNSPLALLAHELIHCYNELFETASYQARKVDHSSRGEKIDADGNDLSFPNAEEVFVIKMTNQVAKRLGEDKRSNYGRTYYPTRSVLSTKPL